MSEVVERVAKAIHTLRNSTPEQQAIAAIKAMREPTEKMKIAAYGEEGYAESFRLMIDAALE
jgi:hypothetical protein